VSTDHYPDLDAYNRGVKRARDAYRYDQAIANDQCRTCQARDRASGRAQCQRCYYVGVLARRWA